MSPEETHGVVTAGGLVENEPPADRGVTPPLDPEGVAHTHKKNITIMSYSNLLYHIIFRPYDGESVLTDEHSEVLYSYIQGFIVNKKCKLYAIGGMPNHIHILLDIHPTIAVSDFVRMLKNSLGNYIKGNAEQYPKFNGWARSYAVFTYSKKEFEVVKNYILRQKEHHKKLTFADELRAFLRAEGVEFDEKYFLKD